MQMPQLPSMGLNKKISNRAEATAKSTGARSIAKPKPVLSAKLSRSEVASTVSNRKNTTVNQTASKIS